jgi:hypothetical protein
LRAHRLPPNIKTFVLQWAMRQIQRSSDTSYVKIFVAKNLFACSIQFIEIPEPSSPIPPRACTLTRAGMFDLKFTDSTFHNQCGAYQCWATALSSNRLSNANQTGTGLPRRSGLYSNYNKRNEQTTVSPIGAILGAEGAFRPPNPSAPASGVISVPLPSVLTILKHGVSPHSGATSDGLIQQNQLVPGLHGVESRAFTIEKIQQ